ncbi:glycoside hydrolase family 43 protein [Cadophora sp. DSE1049]|nr:glycoside hydrolase family 43 protein [Cadophora sp. DSE1049]
MQITNFLTSLTLLITLTNAFTNPIKSAAADPSIITHNATYYQTATGTTQITITRSRTLAGLQKGQTKQVWTDSTPTRNRDMWAPEIHLIDSTWYIFYSASGDANGRSKRSHVLRGKGCDVESGDGPDDCEYEWLAELTPPVGRQAGVDGRDPESIDGTYLVIEGERYHVVSAKDERGEAAIQISSLDTGSWTVEGWSVIARADRGWERDEVALVEGPHPLYHASSTWLTYSGSFCGSPNYALGLLHYIGPDPLSASSWVKISTSQPVVSKANGNYGTGHNCFFYSPDGTEIWNAFHATTNSSGSCGVDRYTMASKMSFDEDNNPVFGVPEKLGTAIQAPSGERG